VRVLVWVATERRAKTLRFVDCSCIERETTRLRNLIGRGHLCVAAEEKRKIVMDLWVEAE
jgi:hypothetical protein